MRAGNWSTECSITSKRALESPRVAEAGKKRDMMQSRSRDYVSSLSAPGALLSLDKRRLMPLTLWLNITFTSRFVSGRGNELLSKEKIA